MGCVTAMRKLVGGFYLKARGVQAIFLSSTEDLGPIMRETCTASWPARSVRRYQSLCVTLVPSRYCL